MRVGVVGANWGLNHVAAWRAVPGVEVAAICTAHRETAEAVARDHAIARAYWNAEELLADPSIDVVDVTTRPSIRAPIALAALAAGKHLLQPLPFALDLAQAAELERRARERGLIANVENLHRHAPAFAAAKDLVERGFLGELYTVQAEVRAANVIGRPPDYVYLWTFEESSGASALRNFGAHLLHVVSWLFGEVAEVAAEIKISERELRFTDGSRKPNGTADTAFVSLRFPAGAVGTLHLSWCTPAPPGFRIDAVGSQGRLVLTADNLGPENAMLQTAAWGDDRLTRSPIGDAFRLPSGSLTNVPPGRRGYELAAMCARMTTEVRTGQPSGAGPDFGEALRVMRTIEAAYDAAARGAWSRVDNFTGARE